MTCVEFKELAAAYVLGSLEASEHEAARTHLASSGSHEGCVELLAALERTRDALADAAAPIKPDPSTWARIEARLDGAAPRVEQVASARGGGAREALAWALAIAAGALLFITYSAWKEVSQAAREGERRATAEQDARAKCEETLAALTPKSRIAREAVALLGRPGTRVLPMGAASADVTERAAALVSQDGKRVLVLSSDVAPDAQTDFQLWVIRGSEPPRPAGFLSLAEGGVAAGEIDPALLAGISPDAIAISREPKGGRPTPTTVLMVAKLGS